MTYAVDFRGWCEIEADSYEEAKAEFWRLIAEDVPLPSSLYEIEGVEKKRG